MNSQVQNELYKKSLDGKNFKNIYKRIISKDNIILAFRNLKSNNGSKTPGYDGKTIIDLEQMEMESIIKMVRCKLANYKPNKIKKFYIQKENGDKRPIGIPTIEDRLIQTCILQVLEPICEGKFKERSYGFRPTRSCHDALARFRQVVELGKNYYCVNIDIKSFFNNIDHNILMRKIWSIGIQDKKVLSIIKKILESEIIGEEKSNKGIIQGGIITPLLSNIYLHEFDKWILSQWEEFPTHKEYCSRNKIYKMLRRRNIKEIWYIRYADDFKIVCKDKETAVKIKYAIEDWLKTRLKLELNEEKSNVINLKKKSTDFLGYQFKITNRNTRNKNTNKLMLDVRISKRKLKNISKKYKKRLRDLVKRPMQYRILLLNKYIIGIHNYYKGAYRPSHDLMSLQLFTYHIMKKYIRFGYIKQIDKNTSQDLTFDKRYKEYGYKTFARDNQIIYPIAGITGNILIPRKDGINPYENNNEQLIPPNCNSGSGSGLFYSNRISKWYQQNGKCYVTGEPLVNMECHHKIPKYMGGDDSYQNLVNIEKDVHVALHKKDKEYPIKNNYNKKQTKRYLELLEIIINNNNK